LLFLLFLRMICAQMLDNSQRRQFIGQKVHAQSEQKKSLLRKS